MENGIGKVGKFPLTPTLPGGEAEPSGALGMISVLERV
jgi:hypothetical protein